MTYKVDDMEFWTVNVGKNRWCFLCGDYPPIIELSDGRDATNISDRALRGQGA